MFVISVKALERGVGSEVSTLVQILDDGEKWLKIYLSIIFLFRKARLIAAQGEAQGQ